MLIDEHFCSYLNGFRSFCNRPDLLFPTTCQRQSEHLFKGVDRLIALVIICFDPRRDGIITHKVKQICIFFV